MLIENLSDPMEHLLEKIREKHKEHPLLNRLKPIIE